MVEETKAEAQGSSTDAPPPQTTEKKAEDLLEKANQSEAELRLIKKEAELKVLESQLDKKIQVLQTLVEQNLQNGKSLVQINIDKATEEKNRINKLLEKTGLKI
jgi:DNA polymerase III delta prime subunit